ncbi:hypothetical protein HZS_7987, partial [Henneguya salminicola]
IILTTLIENTKRRFTLGVLNVNHTWACEENKKKKAILLSKGIIYKSAILSLYPYQIYESLLIELRIKYASSVYTIATKSRIYNRIRENRGSMFVTKFIKQPYIQ